MAGTLGKTAKLLMRNTHYFGSFAASLAIYLETVAAAKERQITS